MVTQASVAGGVSSKKEKEIFFVNVKVFEGGKFSGGTKEPLKTWAKKIKIFLNSQHRGMRKALELPEVGKLSDWEFAVEANEKLHDFLMTYTAEKALQRRRL